jgi:hypothetical protein
MNKRLATKFYKWRAKVTVHMYAGYHPSDKHPKALPCHSLQEQQNLD